MFQITSSTMALAEFPKVRSRTGDLTGGSATAAAALVSAGVRTVSDGGESFGFVSATFGDAVSTEVRAACDEAEPFGFGSATSWIWVRSSFFIGLSLWSD